MGLIFEAFKTLPSAIRRHREERRKRLTRSERIFGWAFSVSPILRARVRRREGALLTPGATLVEIVEAVRGLPYGRPSDRTVEGMLRERRGTCSTKHLFLAQSLSERLPETQPQIMHRVYRLRRDEAERRFGPAVAEFVPPEGFIDVHRYVTIALDGRRVTLDATFPGEPWDGRASIALACGPGQDFPAGAKPDDDKRALEAQCCDAVVREPFIRALTDCSRAGA